MAKRALNVKQMKETLVNYCGGNQDDYDGIWETFRMMRNLGFITHDEWSRFWDETHEWTIEGDYLVNGYTGGIIYDFDNARNGGEFKEFRA